MEESTKTNVKTSHRRGSAKSRIWEQKTCGPIATKLCMPGAVHDLITHANCGEDRLKGFGVAMVEFWLFFTDLLRRLQNTLALPCECVIAS